MYNLTNEEIIKELQLEKRLKTSTMGDYRATINEYTNLLGKTMGELLQEAEDEEEQGIRWKHRKIRKHLINYRLHLIEKYKLSTAKLYLGKIKTVYRHYEIELHDLPSVSTKDADINPPVTYDDLLTKKELRTVIKSTNPLIRSLILFMCSSGCARTETLNLTIQDFINAVEEYTNKTSIYDVLNDLKDKNNIVPTFKLKRQKTNKYYYTFCSPEATQYIISYLLSREEVLTPDKQLFDITKAYLVILFNNLNRQLNMGYAGGHTRLRTHAFRKFHASNLLRGEHPLTIGDIDNLQGRSKDKTHEAYFQVDPQQLKKRYIANMEQVTINQEIDKLTIDSPEVLEIKKDKQELEDKVNRLEASLEKNSDKLDILSKVSLDDINDLLD